MHDVIIVGGSYAGLSAALPLARARRSVLVIDGGVRRNRSASAAHNFLTQDGVPPGEIAALGRAQLLRYGTVQWLDGQVERAEAVDGGFRVTVPGQPAQHARRLILATGVADGLPDIPGLAQRWGRSVFHCPYCHGYELERGRIGVLATSAMSMHHALMLPEWGPTTFFLNGVFAPDAGQLAELAKRGVTVEAGAVRGVGGSPVDVEMADGRVFPLAGLFVLPYTTVAGQLAGQLGCALDEGPLGTFIRTDETKATSVAGVFACGDAARGAGSLPFAVGDGAMAGVAAHRSLIFDV